MFNFKPSSNEKTKVHGNTEKSDRLKEVDEKAILQSRLKEVTAKLERQKTRLKNEESSYALYLEFVADFEKERKEIEEELAWPAKGVSNAEKCVEFAITYSRKLATVWSSANYHDRQRLQFSVFPEGIFTTAKRTIVEPKKVNAVFSYIASLERVIAETKNGTALKISECAALVDLTSKKSNQIWDLLRRIHTLKPVIGQKPPSVLNRKKKTDLELKIIT